MPDEYDLNKFDPRWVERGQISVIIAKKGSGKTTLLLDLLYYQRRIEDGICFLGTEESNDVFDGVVPPAYIFADYDPEVMRKFIRRQRKKNRDCKRDSKPPKDAFVICDDIAGSDDFGSDSQLKKLFMNARWYRVTFYLCMQYVLSIKPVLRSQIDWVFILRENNPQMRERLYKNYVGAFFNYWTFSCFMDILTENYGAIVFKNTGTSNKLNECVFWYRAQIHKAFQMGNAAYRRAHLLRFNSKWDDESSDDDGGGPSAQKPTVRVNRLIGGADLTTVALKSKRRAKSRPPAG